MAFDVVQSYPNELRQYSVPILECEMKYNLDRAKRCEGAGCLTMQHLEYDRYMRQAKACWIEIVARYYIHIHRPIVVVNATGDVLAASEANSIGYALPH